MRVRDTGNTVLSPSESSRSRMFVGEIWGEILAQAPPPPELRSGTYGSKHLHHHCNPHELEGISCSTTDRALKCATIREASRKTDLLPIVALQRMDPTSSSTWSFRGPP